MSGSWGVKPVFTLVNLSAWAFWIVMFVLVLTILALIRIIWMICCRKYKTHTITVIDLHQDSNYNSAQAIYTSVIAPNYFYHAGENLAESVNAIHDKMSNEDKRFFNRNAHKLRRDDSFDGVDSVSESCVYRTTTPIRPLTPAYKPHEVPPNKDPLGFLSVPPGFITTLSSNSVRFERNTHSA